MEPLPRNARRIPTPAALLGPWLAEIDNLAELKLLLRMVALLYEKPTRRDIPPSLSLDDLLDDEVLGQAAPSPSRSDTDARRALAACLSRRTLAAARVGGEVRIWLNDELCRSYLEKAQLSPLRPADVSGADSEEKPSIDDHSAIPAPPPRANIFTLYELHIGAFGHGMAEQLRAAEEEYPTSWIEAAFEIAAERGARSWNYVHAILNGWKQRGKSDLEYGQYHDDGKPGRHSAPDRRTGYLESYRRRHGRSPWESDGTTG